MMRQGLTLLQCRSMLRPLTFKNFYSRPMIMMRPMSLLAPTNFNSTPLIVSVTHRNFAKGGKGKKDKDKKKTEEKAQILEEFDG